MNNQLSPCRKISLTIKIHKIFMNNRTAAPSERLKIFNSVDFQNPNKKTLSIQGKGNVNQQSTCRNWTWLKQASARLWDCLRTLKPTKCGQQVKPSSSKQEPKLMNLAYENRLKGT